MRYLLPLACMLFAAPALAEDAAGAATDAQRAQFKQAFDGAMTCAALTAIKSDAALGDEQQRWANRSFAFGMFAAQIYFQITHKPLSGEELGDAVNQYADALSVKVEEELEPFEKGCAGKYEFADALCRDNQCPFPDVVPPAPAAPGKDAQ